MSTSTCSTIALAGFTQDERTVMVVYLARHLPGEYTLAEDDNTAALLIINMDTPNSLQLWKQKTRNGAVPSIVLSDREQQLTNARWLRKPLQPAELLAMIERGLGLAPAARAHRQLSQDQAAHLHLFQGPGDKIYTDPKARSSLFYRPDDSFQGTLQQALDDARSNHRGLTLVVPLKKMTEVMICADGQYIYTQNMMALLKRARFMRANQGPRVEVKPTADHSINPNRRGASKMYRAEDILWHLAIWTARGRVPEGTDLEAPVILKGRPDFARIGQPAEAMGVIDLWHKRPTPLLATARQLGLPCHVVFSVYSACHALGLVVDRSAQVSRQDASRSTLRLGSMLDKLCKFTGSH